MEERVNRVISASKNNKCKVKVLPNAVDTEKYFPGNRFNAKSEYGIEADRDVLLIAANLSPHKGQETAIRTIPILIKSGYNPLLLIAGRRRA